jgi:hypothetical protein
MTCPLPPRQPPFCCFKVSESADKKALSGFSELSKYAWFVNGLWIAISLRAVNQPAWFCPLEYVHHQQAANET